MVEFVYYGFEFAPKGLNQLMHCLKRLEQSMEIIFMLFMKVAAGEIVVILSRLFYPKPELPCFIMCSSVCRKNSSIPGNHPLDQSEDR